MNKLLDLKKRMYENLKDKYGDRKITKEEIPFVFKILTEDHLSNGVILSNQNELHLMFMSLPLATFLSSMGVEEIDQEFMVYICLLKDLGIEDKRLKKIIK